MNASLLSAILIVKNEEKNLPRCLGSLQGVCDEICVVDTGSTDRTVEIAQKFGARVSTFAWNGNESDARNASAQAATGRWLFTIDADEEISVELARELGKKLPEIDREGKIQSLSVVWRNHYRDQSTSLTRITRIARNFSGFSFHGNIHPVANYRTPTLPLDGCLDHYGYIWTPEQKKKKSAHMLEHLSPFVQQEKPELGRLSQYLTYLLVAEREGEFFQRLEQIQTYSPQDRVAEPYWRQALANLLLHFSEKDDFETGKPFAEEILEAYPSFVGANFYLLQDAVRRRAWNEAPPLARAVLKSLQNQVETANIVFPEIQIPAAQGWLWLAEVLSDEKPEKQCKIPHRLIQSRVVHILLYAQEKLKLVCADKSFAKLLQFHQYLQKNPDAPEWNLFKILESLAELRFAERSAGKLLAALLRLEILYRTQKMPDALSLLSQTLDEYPNHRWLAAAFVSPEQPDWQFYEKFLHQT